MAVYSYRATTKDGAVVEGVIEAVDERLAVERLRGIGIIPLKVSVPRQEARRRFSLRSTRGDLLTFTSELSALLKAGLPLDRSLNIIADISESREMKAVVQTVLKSIREGSSFSEALGKEPRVFPRLYVNMIRAGEAGGVLDLVLEKLGEFLETSKELRDHVVSAAIYPIILFVTGGISIAILLTVVLPKFSTIFADIGTSLPLPTKILLAVSGVLQAYWWLLLGGAVGGWILLRKYIKTTGGRLWWDGLKLKLVGELIRKLETARFARTLGTLLQSGVPLLQALNNARDVISNQRIAGALDGIGKGVKEGKGLAVPLAGANVLPPLALSMIKVGEETGRLDTMLLQVAAAYEKELRTAIKRFVSFFEPAMILGMGVVIGFIVISMLMAIFSMSEIPF